MRVTNSMISNSATAHITNAKNSLLKYSDQYTTQKKIQRPSDDPTVAVRSLKLRTTYSQLTQYAEKNVKDAMSWMDTTETALSNISKKFDNMKSYFNQGANDYLEADNRKDVLATLQQYVKSIFEDEANTDYSGRYVFTGFRTDTSLLFPEGTDKLSYQIKENFSYDSFDNVKVVTGGANYDDSVTDGQDYISATATTKEVYQLRLAYDNCSKDAFGQTGTTGAEIVISLKDKNGNAIKTYAPNGYNPTPDREVTTMKSTDKNAYDIGDDDIRYLYDTGEVLVGKNVYSEIQNSQADFNVTYVKNDFEKGDIRPEMYFECTAYDSVNAKTTNYADPSDQEIQYEINYSQNIIVNTQAKDAISTDIYRVVDYIATTVKYVDEVETKLAEVEKMIKNTTDETKLKTLESLKTALETEKDLRGKVMTEAFGKGLTMIDEAGQKVSVATSELGAKYNRAQLTYNKLLDEQTDAEDKLSENEDVSLTDVYINLTQADNLYQASLSATAKILGNSLLNYI
ncbi:hypothetical protein KQI69_00930 [Eubacterium sp. MSJ-13]|uniref:flagellin N-terminal helical domain-containing protein n=1 Tax=Eubacterium sp. MSJ-13 TaxID=2841513 RepID=UPI001C110667|nr:flagellin [Eubacterium sp. MSJ-13]MBU5477763.1 hypothetical protein [Eubacterium sp. MSJ-13]